MAEQPNPRSLEELVPIAIQGDRESLNRLVDGIQRPVYNLALRMLWHPEDAEDAAQEILIRVVTGLGSFEGRSAFMTWVYRVAANHLLTTRKRRMERPEMSFSDFAHDLATGLDEPPAREWSPGEQALLVEEVKLGCTLGMLLCLDREHRLAYILGEVFEVSGEEGGFIMQVDPAAYRKRLSRARRRIREFMEHECGLVSEAAACRCTKRLGAAIRRGRVDPDRLLFASATGGRPDIDRAVQEMELLHRSAGLYRSHPDFEAPETVAGAVHHVLDPDRFPLMLGE